MATVLGHWDMKSDVRIDLQPEESDRCIPVGVCTYLSASKAFKRCSFQVARNLGKSGLSVGCQYGLIQVGLWQLQMLRRPEARDLIRSREVVVMSGGAGQK